MPCFRATCGVNLRWAPQLDLSEPRVAATTRGQTVRRCRNRAEVPAQISAAEPAFWGSHRSDDLYAPPACEPRPYRAIGRVKGKSDLPATPAPEPPFGASRVPEQRGSALVSRDRSLRVRRFEGAVNSRAVSTRAIGRSRPSLRRMTSGSVRGGALAITGGIGNGICPAFDDPAGGAYRRRPV